MADFVFCLKDGTEILSHRYALAVHSKYFKEKFDLNPSFSHLLLPDQFRSDIMNFVVFGIYNRYVNIPQSNLLAFAEAVKYLQFNGFDQIQLNDLKCERELSVSIKRLPKSVCDICNDKSNQMDNDSRKKSKKSVKFKKNSSKEKVDSTSLKRNKGRTKKIMKNSEINKGAEELYSVEKVLSAQPSSPKWKS